MSGQQPSTQTSSRTLLLVVLGLVAVAVIVAIIVFWPRDREPTCIKLPEVSDETILKSALALGVKLERLPLDSNLKGTFEETSKTTFRELSDREVAFLLLLRAIECYIKSADTPQKVELVKALAPELIATARSMWASAHSLRGEGDTLTIKERDLLEASPLGEPILVVLREHGLQ